MRTKVELLNAPAYSVLEAAHFLRMPKATLRAWVLGQSYTAKASGPRTFTPVIEIADHRANYLSFINLVEAHVLSAIRRKHHVPLPNVRAAVEYVRQRLGTPRPLADVQFMTDGVSLFVESLGQLVNASRDGQIGMREMLELYLKRIDRDPEGLPIRLYPFTRTVESVEPGIVAIDPEIAFGRPVIQRISVPTAVIADRYKAGDSILSLSQDYGAANNEIEEAIRCEFEAQAA